MDPGLFVCGGYGIGMRQASGRTFTRRYLEGSKQIKRSTGFVIAGNSVSMAFRHSMDHCPGYLILHSDTFQNSAHEVFRESNGLLQGNNYMA